MKDGTESWSYQSLLSLQSNKTVDTKSIIYQMSCLWVFSGWMLHFPFQSRIAAQWRKRPPEAFKHARGVGGLKLSIFHQRWWMVSNSSIKIEMPTITYHISKKPQMQDRWHWRCKAAFLFLRRSCRCPYYHLLVQHSSVDLTSLTKGCVGRNYWW